MEKIQISIRIDDELSKKLKILAIESNKTRDELISEILAKQLKTR